MRMAQRMMLGLENAITKIELMHKRMGTKKNEEQPGKQRRRESKGEFRVPNYPDSMTRDML